MHTVHSSQGMPVTDCCRVLGCCAVVPDHISGCAGLVCLLSDWPFPADAQSALTLPDSLHVVCQACDLLLTNASALITGDRKRRRPSSHPLQPPADLTEPEDWEVTSQGSAQAAAAKPGRPGATFAHITVGAPTRKQRRHTRRLQAAPVASFEVRLHAALASKITPCYSRRMFSDGALLAEQWCSGGVKMVQ